MYVDWVRNSRTDRGRFRIEQVHECFLEIELRPHRMREKIGIDQDAIGRAERLKA